MDSVKVPEKMSFKDAREDFHRFRQMFEFYMLASKKIKNSEEEKIAELITFLGHEGLDVYNTFDIRKEELNLKNVLDKFQSHCVSAVNPVVETCLFNKIYQKSGQSIDDFITEIKKQADMCKFVCEKNDCQMSYKNRMIRDRIIIGVFDENLRIRLLAEKDLTLDKTIEIVKAGEALKMQVKIFREDTAELSIDAIHVNTKTQFKSNAVTKNHNNNSQRSCNRCGYSHFNRKCPAEGKTCKKCQRKNHFASVCQSKTIQLVSTQNDDGQPEIDQHNLSDTGNYSFILDSVCDNLLRTGAWMKDVLVNDCKIIKFKLDTGAECNILSRKTLVSVFNHKPLDIMKKVGIDLISYGNFRIKTIGRINLRCKTDKKSEILNFFVVDENLQSLLGLDACLKLNLIKRVDAVESIRSNVTFNDPLIQKYSDVFEGIGKIPGKYKIKIDENAIPSIKYRKVVPFALHEKLKMKLDDLVDKDIISKVQHPTEWVNNIMLVEKSSGELRICLDPKPLNKFIKREHYMIPTSDDILARLSGKKFFSVIDMKDGFWQLELDQESADLCTFATPFGRYQFKRLAMGLNSAPEVFHREMVEIFGSIAGVEPYFDDLIISGVSIEDHDRVLENVLKQAREYNVKFNIKKIQLRAKEVSFMGHIISESGVLPSNKHIKAITNFEMPKNKKDVMRFLGITKYLARFIPNLSQLSSNLRKLTKQNVNFEFNETHAKEINKLKNIITSQPILKIFEINKPCVIQSDASSEGLGCVLLQEGHPISYASRSLTMTEKKYSQIEKELLAIVFACNKFHQYIYGRQIIVHTDHKPLTKIIYDDLDKASFRLQRMLLKLLRYNLKLEYIPGRDMLIADALSRASLDVDGDDENELAFSINCVNQLYLSDENKISLRNALKTDRTLSNVMSFVTNGWSNDIINKSNFEIRHYYKLRDDISLDDDLLFFKNKLIVPESYKTNILFDLHYCHAGIEKMKKRGREMYYWPNMNYDITKFVQMCKSCQKFQKSKQKAPLKSHELADFPWEKISVDIMEFHSKNYLVIVDAYSNLLVLVPIANKSALEVVEQFTSVFSKFGFPCYIVADNNPFNSAEVKQFAKKWNIGLIFTSPHHHQSNGLVERAVGIVKEIYRKLCDESRTNDIQLAILEYNNSKLSHMNYSPSQLFFGRNQKTKCITNSSHLMPIFVDKKEVKQQKLNIRDRQKYYYDRTAKASETFNKGDTVMLQNYKNKYWEPAKIVDVENENYVVENSIGSKVRRNPIFLRPTQIAFSSKMPLNVYNFIKTYNTNNDHSDVQFTNVDSTPQSNVEVTQETDVPYEPNEIFNNQSILESSSLSNYESSNEVPIETRPAYKTRSGRLSVIPSYLKKLYNLD